MPVNYLVEMVMDRIAACKVYRGKDYTDASAWEYYQRERPYLNSAMHTETRAELEKILIMLKQRGEKTTFSYLRKLLKKGNCKVFDNSDQIAWLFYRSCSMLCC